MENKLDLLRIKIKELYDKNNDLLLFHGWHHIYFISKKAVEFSESIGADKSIAEASALVHDLNYIVEINSEPQAGAQLRESLLKDAGYSPQEIANIENIITESHAGTRTAEISKEGMALSDADTLFKALPITPILFASRYITENKIDIAKLAKKVTSEQKPLLDKNIYFYTNVAKDKYLNWAKVNLDLWQNVEESLEDKDVQELLTISYQRGVL